jgi:hypothetical protein
MKAPSSFQAVIDLWPSRTALASEMGLPDAGIVRTWRNRDRIPDEYWSGLVAAAAARKLRTVTPELLTALAATKRAAA